MTMFPRQLDYNSFIWYSAQNSVIEKSNNIYGYVYRVDILSKRLYYIGQQKGPLTFGYRGHGVWIMNYVKKYGAADLLVTVLGWADTASGLNAAEYFLLGDRWKTDSACMNLRPGGGAKPGGPESAETKQRKSDANKGRKLSTEHIEKLRAVHLGAKRSEQACRNISEGVRRAMTQEVRKKLSDAVKGHINPMLGKHHTEETRKKISDARKGKHFSPFTEEHKRKIAEAQRGYRHWTNGVENRFCLECPQGFWAGCTRRKKDA